MKEWWRCFRRWREVRMLEREVAIVEKYGDQNDPKRRELIARAKQKISELRAS